MSQENAEIVRRWSAAASAGPEDARAAVAEYWDADADYYPVRPANLTAEQYDQVVQKELDEPQYPPDGRDYHVCFGSEGNLTVSETWDSQEQLDAYGERLMPILAEAGIEMAAEPEVFEVHRIDKRRRVMGAAGLEPATSRV